MRFHGDRKPLRLKNYDYNQVGGYFITICTKNREYFLGEIKDSEMQLSPHGEIAALCWQKIPDHFANVSLDEYIIMPNHIHGIIIIKNAPVGNADLRSLRQHRTKMTLSKIVHGYKSSVTRSIRNHYQNFEFAWQKSYYDHIICNENHLNNIREYIVNNVTNWHLDVENNNFIST